MAGAVEHETGTRDVTVLAGLRRGMPYTALAGLLAAASMAGIPLFLGFVAKEQFYESVRTFSVLGVWPGVAISAAVLASVFLGAAGLITGISPFAGQTADPDETHEAPASMWLGPLLLGGAGLFLGVLPAMIDTPVRLAAAAVVRHTVPVSLEIWHGVSATVLLSATTLAGSISLFIYRERIRRLRLASIPRNRAALHLIAGRSRCGQPMGGACAPKRFVAFIRADGCSDGRCVRRDGSRDRGAVARLETLGHRSNLTKVWSPCSLSQPLCRRHSRARTWSRRSRLVRLGTESRSSTPCSGLPISR